MKMRMFWLMLCLAAAMALPWAAGASSAEGGEGWGLVESAGRWFNLLFLFGVIFYFVRKPMVHYFERRRAEIQEQIGAAALARKAAEETRAQVEARVQNLDQELLAIRQDAQKQADLERQKIAEQAAREADKIVSAARREIEGLSLTVRKDLQSYAARLAVELAEEKVRRDLTPQADERVVEGFFRDLSAGGGR